VCSQYRFRFLTAEPHQIWDSITTKKDTSLLNRFFLITYADLKKYKYYYWFSFPAFVSKPAWEIGEDGWKAADSELGVEEVSKQYFVLDHILMPLAVQLKTIHAKLQSDSRPFFLVRTAENSVQIGSIEDHDQFFANVPSTSVRHPSFDPHQCKGVVV
jgi:ubiquitin-like modifier-activating enzyme ATG7